MANPIISRTEMAVGGRAMTVNGTVAKTSMLLAISALTGIGFLFYILTTGMSYGMVRAISFGSIIATIGLGFLVMFKPQLAKVVAVPYAVLEGLFIGAISMYAMSISPSIPMTAVCATFVTAALMLGLYRSGLIKVTAKFRSIITSATIAIMILYMVQVAMSFIFKSSIPFLFDGGIIAIGFCLFVICIASFNLLLDFDNIERGVQMGISEDYEWVFSIGVLATLVWMYFEFIRLLGYLQD